MLEYLYGLLNLNFWGYVIVAFVMVQISMMSVTLYLHRDQAHRAIDLHPVLRIFFRIWIWMTSGMQTREWVAVHRKHHALCERDGDPHSGHGLRRDLLLRRGSGPHQGPPLAQPSQQSGPAFRSRETPSHGACGVASVEEFRREAGASTQVTSFPLSGPSP